MAPVFHRGPGPHRSGLVLKRAVFAPLRGPVIQVEVPMPSSTPKSVAGLQGPPADVPDIDVGLGPSVHADAGPRPCAEPRPAGDAREQLRTKEGGGPVIVSTNGFHPRVEAAVIDLVVLAAVQVRRRCIDASPDGCDYP